eukprot:748738-Hanusia_phi.AAC.2
MTMCGCSQWQKPRRRMGGRNHWTKSLFPVSVDICIEPDCRVDRVKKIRVLMRTVITIHAPFKHVQWNAKILLESVAEHENLD